MDASLKKWSNWLSLAEWCYNTTVHSSTIVTPFEALYGLAPPRLMTYILGTSANTLVDEQLKYRDELWGLLKDNLQKAQHKMKHFAD